jgi:hypothetical protein
VAVVVKVRRVLAAVVLVLAVVALAVPSAAAQTATFRFGVTELRRGSDPATAEASGTFRCGPLTDNRGVVDLTVRQGSTTGYGYVYLDGACDGTTHTWTATVTSYNGTYRRGRAAVTASGYAEGTEGLQTTRFSASRRIR